MKSDSEYSDDEDSNLLYYFTFVKDSNTERFNDSELIDIIKEDPKTGGKKARVISRNNLSSSVDVVYNSANDYTISTTKTVYNSDNDYRTIFKTKTANKPEITRISTPEFEHIFREKTSIKDYNKDTINFDAIIDNLVNRINLAKNPECFKSVDIKGYYFCEKFVQKHTKEKIIDTINYVIKKTKNIKNTLKPHKYDEIVRRYVINELTTCNGEVCDVQNESYAKIYRPDDELFNTHIENVMINLEELYPEFKYLGFNMRGHKEHAALVRIHNKSRPKLYSQLIDPNKIIDSSHTKYCLVLNTDSWTSGGEHWQCIYIDTLDETVSLFDSMDSEYDTELFNHIADTLNYKKITKNNVIQKGNIECGVFVLFYVICRLLGLNHETFINIKNTDLSDSFCSKLRNIVFINDIDIIESKRYVAENPLNYL